MLLHDVVVVEQPITGRADVAAAVGGGGQPGLRILQDAARPVQPGEERRAPACGAGGQPLALRQLLGALRQVLGAEQLAADGPSEEGLGCVRAAGEDTEEKSSRSQRGNGGPLEESGTQCRRV